MGRTIIADENVKSCIKYFTHIPYCVVGLVIGQNTLQRDYVCHLSKTPVKQQVENLSQSADPLPKEKKVGKEKKHQTIDELDESLTIQHAKQVIRMLPGGISVIGVFTVSAGDVLPQNAMSKLKQILMGIFKEFKKQTEVPSLTEVSEKMVLNINSASEKVTAKVFDLANIHDSAKPAEFKFQTGGLNWHQFDCRFALDLSIPIGCEHSTLPLIKQIQNGLTPFCTAMENAVVLIDGKLMKPDESLERSRETKRGKQKEKSANITHLAELFIELFSHYKTEEGKLKDCDVIMHLRGTLKSRAYVHGKATAHEAVQAVKQDIIRSLLARLEIHCEDLLLIDEEQHDAQVVHEPPRRVFATLPGSSITVSDYLFPGEKAKDSLDAYNELLSLNLTEEDIEFDCERTAESSDLAPCPSETGNNNTTSYDMVNAANSSKSGNLLVLALSVAVVALATSITYLMFRGEDAP